MILFPIPSHPFVKKSSSHPWQNVLSRATIVAVQLCRNCNFGISTNKLFASIFRLWRNKILDLVEIACFARIKLARIELDENFDSVEILISILASLILAKHACEKFVCRHAEVAVSAHLNRNNRSPRQNVLQCSRRKNYPLTTSPVKETSLPNTT